MASESNRLLQEGIAAAKSGQAEMARERLLQAIDLDERNEQAWLWLSQVVEGDEERYICMENVLSINPGNAMAKAGLEYLRQQGVKPPTQEEKPPAVEEEPFPWMAEEPQAAVGPAVDWPFQQQEEPEPSPPVEEEDLSWLPQAGQQTEALPDWLTQEEDGQPQQTAALPSWLSEAEPGVEAKPEAAQEGQPDWLKSPWAVETEAQLGEGTAWPADEVKAAPGWSEEEGEEERPAERPLPAWVSNEETLARPAQAWVNEETAVRQAKPAWVGGEETQVRQSAARVGPIEEPVAGDTLRWEEEGRKDEKEKKETKGPPFSPLTESAAPKEEKARQGSPLKMIGIALIAVVACLLVMAVGLFVVLPMVQPPAAPPPPAPASHFPNVPVYQGAALLQYTPSATDSWERYKLVNVQPPQVLDFYKNEMPKSGWTLSQEDAKSLTFTSGKVMVMVVAEPYQDFILLTIGMRQEG